MAIETGKRLTGSASALAQSIHINVARPTIGPNGTAWHMVQAYHSPDPPPETCPQGHGETVEDGIGADGKPILRPAYVVDARGWPVCAIDGYDSSPMARARAGEDIVKQAVYVPANVTVAQLVTRIVARATAVRAEGDRSVAVFARLSIDAAIAVQVREMITLDTSQTDGTALRRIVFDRLRATLDGVTAEELDLLVPADMTPIDIRAAILARLQRV